MLKAMLCVRMTAVMLSSAQVVSAFRTNAVLKTTSFSPIPQFTFNIKDTLCADPDFGALTGVLTAYPDVVKRIKDVGLKWANEYNCRLCDISAEQGSMGNASATCAAYAGYIKSNTKETCLAGNGKHGWLRDNNVCVPCPNECESCLKPSFTDVTYLSHKWFRCVLPGETGATPVPAPWTCERVQDRRKHRGQFQWCQYRLDLLGTATNGNKPSSSGKWEMKITAAPCGGVHGTGDGAVAGIMEAVGPSLTKQYQRNCNLCRITAGGPLDTKSPTEFIAGTRKSKPSKPWAEGACAYDEIGSPACRTDRGQLGWNKKEGCNPCPVQCALCLDSNSMFGSKGFSCKLHPSTSAQVQLDNLFIAGASAPTDESEIAQITLPEGYDCKTPKKRTCGKMGGSVLCMGYKVWCKYRQWSD